MCKVRHPEACTQAEGSLLSYGETLREYPQSDKRLCTRRTLPVRDDLGSGNHTHEARFDRHACLS